MRFSLSERASSTAVTPVTLNILLAGFDRHVGPVHCSQCGMNPSSMYFESPIWLWGLLLWIAVVMDLLIGRGRLAVVPFLPFWKGAVVTSGKRSWSMPPISVLLMLLALLLAVVAAADPAYRGSASAKQDITVVLDCGSTMARPGSGELFRGVIDKANNELGPVTGRVSIVAVPGQRVDSNGANWVAAAGAMSPTAIVVHLDQVVADELHQARGPIVVLSDQPLHISDSRIIQIVPDAPIPNVAITQLAARLLPHPQVMIGLENHSDLRFAHIIVTSGSVKIERQIVLKNRQDEFIDLPGLNTWITAELDQQPSSSPWSKAFLVRQSAGVQLSVLGDVPVPVKHMAEVYSKDRPAQPGSPNVFISDRLLPVRQAGIWVESVLDADAVGSATALPHTVTRNVKTWPTRGKSGNAPSGFKPVVTLGEDPIVAVRESPAHQLWIRADLSGWEKTPDFVIFFANALDWIADADQQYTSTSPTLLGTDWKSANGVGRVPTGAWPGLFHSESGTWLAVNAGKYPSVSTVKTTPADIHPAGILRQHKSLQSAVIACALLSVMVAVSIWHAATPARRGAPSATDQQGQTRVVDPLARARLRSRSSLMP
jgi:hypothetical protein